MLMATIEILGWKEHDAGFTGWDGRARTELAKFVLANASRCATSTTIQSQVCGKLLKLWAQNLELIRK